MSKLEDKTITEKEAMAILQDMLKISPLNKEKAFSLQENIKNDFAKKYSHRTRIGIIQLFTVLIALERDASVLKVGK